jgi:hypothetical protein
MQCFSDSCHGWSLKYISLRNHILWNVEGFVMSVQCHALFYIHTGARFQHGSWKIWKICQMLRVVKNGAQKMF